MKKILKKRNLFMIITFLIVFFFQVILNRNEIVPRSLPDEVGSMATAANLAGYDWSYVLSQSNMYYGFGTTLFAFSIFRIFKDPLIIYQAFLAWGALLRTIPVFFCFDILHKCEFEDDWLASLISAIAVIGAPTRATNIDNEPMLVLLGWCIFYCFFLLQRSRGKKTKILYSIVLALILAFSITVHTRGYIYIIISLFLCAVYLIFKRKAIVRFEFFLVVLGIGIMTALWSVKCVQASVYTNAMFDNTNLSNTLSSVSSQVTNTIVDTFLSRDGIYSFLVIITSNLWISFVFSCGIVIYSIFKTLLSSGSLFHKTNEANGNADDCLLIPSLFAVGVFIASLMGLGITWIWGPLNVWRNNMELDRGFFYLRYYGNTFGPIIFMGCYYLLKKKEDKKTIVFLSLSTIVAAKVVISSVISFTTLNGKMNGDWFGYFAPFSLVNNRWGESKQDTFYFMSATIISVLLFVLILSLSRMKSKKIFDISFMAVLLLAISFEYAFSVINWDKPYSHSDKYYESVDEIYNISKKTDIFSDVTSVYYLNDTWGKQFIVQLVLYDKMLISDEIDSVKDNLVIISSTKDKLDDMYRKYGDEFHYFELDDNEFIITNETDKRNKISSLGYAEIY